MIVLENAAINPDHIVSATLAVVSDDAGKYSLELQFSTTSGKMLKLRRADDSETVNLYHSYLQQSGVSDDKAAEIVKAFRKEYFGE